MNREEQNNMRTLVVFVGVVLMGLYMKLDPERDREEHARFWLSIFAVFIWFGTVHSLADTWEIILYGRRHSVYLMPLSFAYRTLTGTVIYHFLRVFLEFKHPMLILEFGGLIACQVILHNTLFRAPEEFFNSQYVQEFDRVQLN